MKPIRFDSNSCTNLEYLYLVRGVLKEHFFLLGKIYVRPIKSCGSHCLFSGTWM